MQINHPSASPLGRTVLESGPMLASIKSSGRADGIAPSERTDLPPSDGKMQIGNYCGQVGQFVMRALLGLVNRRCRGGIGVLGPYIAAFDYGRH